MNDRYIDPNSGAAPQPGGSFFDPSKAPDEETPVQEPEQAEDSEKSEEHENAYGVPSSESEATSAKSQETQATGLPQAQKQDSDEDSDDEDSDKDENDENKDEDGQDQGQSAPVSEYDPSKYNVPEVLAYVKEHPEEKDAILEKEKASENRSGVVKALSE